MKKKLMYELKGTNNGFIRSYIVPRQLRRDKHKVDLVELEWYFPNSSKNVYNVALKEWEALGIIEALVTVLMENKCSKLPSRIRINKILS